MKEYLYKVSLIVPVYNVSEYLRDCLDSIVSQSIDKNDFEVLLIDDGSTDNSLEICKEYAEVFDIFKVFTKKNEGLSATRNFGIRRAKGKYLMYLDSDDTISPATVESVSSFFENHYEEVDLVTYKDQPYKFGKKIKAHYRYRYLTKSGIYSLKEYPYITQTRVNICVKNLFEKNFFFDETPEFRLEDQEYCSKILREKLKIGYCGKGEYRYNRSNDGSLVSKYFYAYYIFESSMKYFEDMLGSFDEDIPEYFQAMFLNDVIWKLYADILFPYHYDKNKFNTAIERIKNLLRKVDNNVIIGHPELDTFTRQYWLNMKPNSFPVIYPDNSAVNILVDGQTIYRRANFEIIMHKIRIEKGHLRFLGFVKSPIYTYIKDDVQLFVCEKSDKYKRKQLKVFDSIHSFYRSNAKTCRFFAFFYHCDIENVSQFHFEVELDGITYDTEFWCQPTAVFKNNINSYIRENIKISLEENIISLQKLSKEEIYDFEINQTLLFKQKKDVYNIRLKSLEYRKHHRVCLYYDLYTVEKDNGYYQFIHDFEYSDGIERYYVYNRNLGEIEHLFSEKQKKHLIKFGSLKHKLLYVSAEMVFTAFYGFTVISPFGNEEAEGDYIDIIKFKTIYLQHGVLHANLTLKNHVERCRADKIVISSSFERENLMKNYGYEEDELICTGMARYDHIDRTKNKKNRILFAPSWREYFTLVKGGAQWEVLKDKITDSDYYKKFYRFLKNKKLQKVLRENDIHLDIRLHPIIRNTKGLFTDVTNDYIHLLSKETDIEDYSLFITDFSSFAFDFVYLQRAIIYFVPDMEQFKSGMNHYRELDLPFEEGFGKLVLESLDAVNEVNRIINNKFVPDRKFMKRMKEFFFDNNDYSASLYDYVINNCTNDT